jgi:DNA repair photolyase
MGDILKPCPFCGGVPQIDSSYNGCSIFCANCYAQTFRGRDKKDVTIRWNNREIDDAKLAIADAAIEWVGRRDFVKNMCCSPNNVKLTNDSKRKFERLVRKYKGE